MSFRESIKASVKVTLTDSDGKVLKVIEGENPDPFDRQFLMLLLQGFFGRIGAYSIIDIFYITRWVYVSPTSTFPGFGALSMPPCLLNCNGLPNSPPNGPGFLFFSDVPPYGHSVVYCEDMIDSGVAYSPLYVSPSDIVYLLNTSVDTVSFVVSQSATNVSGSPITVSTISLVAAIAGTADPSPVIIPVSYYILSPPIIWSPGVTMTVSVTYTFPYGRVVPQA